MGSLNGYDALQSIGLGVNLRPGHRSCFKRSSSTKMKPKTGLAHSLSDIHYPNRNFEVKKPLKKEKGCVTQRHWAPNTAA